MSEPQTIAVATETDLIVARMQVRDRARSLGMDLADQARIALAMWSAARALGLGSVCKGQVQVGVIGDGCRQGVQVICQGRRTGEGDIDPAALREVSWMVDDLSFENGLPDSHITLIKWRAAKEARAV